MAFIWQQWSCLRPGTPAHWVHNSIVTYLFNRRHCVSVNLWDFVVFQERLWPYEKLLSLNHCWALNGRLSFIKFWRGLSGCDDKWHFFFTPKQTRKREWVADIQGESRAGLKGRPFLSFRPIDWHSLAALNPAPSTRLITAALGRIQHQHQGTED